MASTSVGARFTSLTKLFHDVIHGRRQLTTSRDGKLFIEALCVQEDAAACAHKLLSSSDGLTSVQYAMRFDTSPGFLNEHAKNILVYLQDPILTAIDSGLVLSRIVRSIVEPPFFWDAYTKAFVEGILSSDASSTYAWLLLQLVCAPESSTAAQVLIAKTPSILESILRDSNGATRNLGQKIKHALPLAQEDLHIDAETKPGGRHDNDHADYRQISIMPTADELMSRERPFLRTSEFLNSSNQVDHLKNLHVDNQFRLLREDMLGEIREEVQIIQGAKSGRHRGVTITELRLHGLEMGTDRKRCPWGITFLRVGGLVQLRNVKDDMKLDWLKKNKQFLQHRNMACLVVDDEIVAFPTIHRDEKALSQIPATITIQFQDDQTLSNALHKMKDAKDIKLTQLDSATFAYEPFLRRLQELKELPLSDEILHWREEGDILSPTFKPTDLLRRLEEHSGKNLKDILGTTKSITLDDSQMISLCTGLSTRLSLIQGPPGCGKSFIGALQAKVIYDHTKQVILVICFTNHALDQFLEDLLDIGIPSSDMIRLGWKSNDRTKPLTLREQTSTSTTAHEWALIDKLKIQMAHHEVLLDGVFTRYSSVNASKQHLMEYLEFLSGDIPFFEAFTIPPDAEGDIGMTRVGNKGGRKMSQYYLLDRWVRGVDAGSLQDLLPKDTNGVWMMPPLARESHLKKWKFAILDDLVTEIRDSGRKFNVAQAEIERIKKERDATIIKSKRIIACTTNGAATYFQPIQSAAPGVVLVEEAGEILESHIITALGPSTQQLILIGDHQQLRPKCSYELSVAKGEGFDLNRSLFERLILKGFPHITLNQQHRMRPEISSIIRHLTYPDLKDAPKTLNRPKLRGFLVNVVFVDHSEPEIEQKAVELRDGKSSSKQNKFEGHMILKCVRYLAQQGYGADKIVVITPYLGQLKLLLELLAQYNDPILNDLDKVDLIRAGILPVASSTSKPKLRVSTVDNYQGEESDIILASFTRCNKSNDIGFMSEPERLNVLLSRARNALIMIGSRETFFNARKGRDLWQKFFKFLEEESHIYNGFPVKCEKHPDRTATLSTPEDFDLHCPDGGCTEPCGTMLKCGIHNCPSSCHRVVDHSEILCREPMKQQCPNGHPQPWRCHQGAPKVCHKCEKEKKDIQKKAQKDFDDKLRREEMSKKHQKRMIELEEAIERVNQSMKDTRLEAEQTAIYAQKKKDLLAAIERAKKAAEQIKQRTTPIDSTSSTNLPSHSPITPNTSIKSSKSPQSPKGPNSTTKSTSSTQNGTKTISQSRQVLQQHLKTAMAHNKSPSKTEWQRQKDQEGAVDHSIDQIMDMIGLEDVKSQVLKIKAKVETSVRQDTDLKKERLGLVLVGNPGTGKTTVARHYARILCSLKALPGDGFVETTGSRLAHGGIAEARKHLALLDEGGAYFIDEAYQLTEAHNHGGKMVLDFLLAEIENLVGKIVFIFAGYRREMERFWEHNPGLASRLPYTFRFEDYTDGELLTMLQYQMNKFYKGAMMIEDGPGGLYMRIAIRRLGKGRGRNGFGNARALENMFQRIRERQSTRLMEERRQGSSPDDMLIAKEDLIGPDPSTAILTCDAWVQLQKLTGLKSVKQSVKFMIDLIKTNYGRELSELPVVEVSLNRVFLGSPGTGKTTVAKMYGEILAALGMLSNGEVIIKNPSDFIGSVIGASEVNTKAILAASVGKVLIIDEAYMLSGSSHDGGSSGADVYKTAVIDTLVAEVQSTLGEDRCVLLLGYEPQMVQMFQNVNPGLTRRFPLSDAFHFDDFNDSELLEILHLKLKQQGLSASQPAQVVAIDVLSRLRNGLNFGNGGDVENLISKAKSNYQARQSKVAEEDRSIDFEFEPEDFDPDYNRTAGAETNLQELFKDVIGCMEIVSKLDDFVKVAKGMRMQGLDPRGSIPMNFIFKGPPGTGKTTTARKFGKVFFDLGFLSQVEVIECSASDFIGQYIGHTGPKTIKQLERGLGKVLFIDEAYRFGEGQFAQEAVNELVDCITKPQFAGKMVVILAGYDNDMNKLLQVNEGLGSRFADEIIFKPLSSEDCMKLLEARLKQSQIHIHCLQVLTTYDTMLERILELSNLPSWGNARDVQTLAKSMVRAVYASNTTKVAQLAISKDVALQCIQSMLDDRIARNRTHSSSRPPVFGQAQPASNIQQPPNTSVNTSTSQKAKYNNQNKENEPEQKKKPVTSFEPEDKYQPRDAGVSDATWAQLQHDIKLAEQDRLEREKSIEKHQAANLLAVEAENRAQKLYDDAMREIEAKHQAEVIEQERRREEARIKALEAQAERERIQEALQRRMEEERKRREVEQAIQAKLRHMGVCVVGYRWIKQDHGYRCAGGAHFISNGQLGM